MSESEQRNDEPNQEHAPYPDETVVAMESLAFEAVKEWDGGVRNNSVAKATATGETGSKAGVHVSVSFDGWLSGPFKPYVAENGVAHLDRIASDGKVTVRVVLEE